MLEKPSEPRTHRHQMGDPQLPPVGRQLPGEHGGGGKVAFRAQGVWRDDCRRALRLSPQV